MNRQLLVVLTLGIAAALFAAGTGFYLSSEPPPTTSSATTTTTLVGPEGTGEPLLRAHAPRFGPVDAPVTIVEFFDPACEACRAFHPIVKKIMATFPGQVNLRLRYTAFHGPSETAIRILEAARQQDRFEPVLDALLETQPRWAPHGRSPEDPWQFLTDTGLDIERARRDAQSPAVEAVLAQDAADVQAVGVRRTPTFFVNGKPLTQFGAQQLYDLVEREVAAK